MQARTLPGGVGAGVGLPVVVPGGRPRESGSAGLALRRGQGLDTVTAIRYRAITPLSRAEPSRAEPSRAEPSRAEPSRAEPSRAEPSRAEPSRAEPSRAEPSRAEPSRAEPSRAEPSRAEPSRAEPSRAEPSRAEPSRAEPSRAEPSRAEPSRAEPSRAEPSRAEPSREVNSGAGYRSRRGRGASAPARTPGRSTKPGRDHIVDQPDHTGGLDRHLYGRAERPADRHRDDLGHRER